MLDEYLWGHIERISPEAPVPILNIIRRSMTLGGAGNVVENLRTFGVQVTVFGVTGADQTGQQVRDLLRNRGADTKGLISDPRRKTTRKARLMSLEHGQQVFRLDEECTAVLQDGIEENMVSKIHAMDDGIQAIVCSDYLKGVLTERVLTAAFTVARKRGIRSIVAPKDSNTEKYRGAHILMPNLRELMQLSPAKDNTERTMDNTAHQVIENLSLEALVVTRGSEGMSLFEKSGIALHRVDIPTTARSVYDVTGAGDTAIAAFAAAIAAGSDLESASHLANVAAGIKVGKRGTVSVSTEEIRLSLQA
jgi:D-beta-D-heptose 7-phosphate kinase / D-beta-D-heptose 1-phosphate adenosyltransferase